MLMTQVNVTPGFVSTLAGRRTLNSMNTDNKRITRAEAADLAGVSERTINRASAAGQIRVWHDPKFREPARYDRDEVIAWAERRLERIAATVTLELPSVTEDSTEST